MRRDEIATHFQSDSLAQKYIDGLIDWDGNELEDPDAWLYR